MTWIRTFSGKRFDFAAPTPDMVDYWDVARAISRTNRFNGHCHGVVPYNVAQHCVLASYLVHAVEVNCYNDPSSAQLAMQALCHDAPEAYTGDMCAPLKRLPELAPYREVDKRVTLAVHAALGVPAELHHNIKVVDVRMLGTEMDSLMGDYSDSGTLPAKPFPFRIKTVWDHETAEFRWARRYVDLRNRLSVEPLGMRGMDPDGIRECQDIISRGWV